MFEFVASFTGEKRLPTNHRQTVYPNGTLIIRDITKEGDEGQYSCTAINDEGVQSTNEFYLIVQGI